MRFWGYFAAKIGLSAAGMGGLLALLNHFWPRAPRFYNYAPPRFGYDLLYTFVTGLWFLMACGLVYVCVWDQRYRCRVCLRRLRMPVETGSWSRMLLLGRPRIEYICIYGHGTLNVAELQISGLENSEWNPHGEMWDELCASSRDADGRDGF
jgi:hypothetical protein